MVKFKDLDRGDFNMLKLIVKAPDTGEGWKHVSDSVLPALETLPAGLIELRPNGVRLTEIGKKFVDFI